MRKTFNITDKDMDIMPHLDSQINMSKYLISLVRKDMAGITDIETRVIEIVEKYLSKRNIVTDKHEEFPMESVLSIIGG